MAAVTSCENTPFSISDLLWLWLYLQKKLNAGWLLDTRTCRKVAIAKIWPYGTCSSLRIFHSVWSWERIWSEAPVTKICSKPKSNLVPTGLFSVDWHQDPGHFQSRKWPESVLLVLTKWKPDSGDEIEALHDVIAVEVNSFKWNALPFLRQHELFFHRFLRFPQLLIWQSSSITLRIQNGHSCKISLYRRASCCEIMFVTSYMNLRRIFSSSQDRLEFVF